MNMKTAIGVVAALVVIGGAFYFYRGEVQAPAVQNTQNKDQVAWAFASKGEDANGIPQTEVSLNGRVVGTYQGSCAEIDGTSWTLLAGELSGVICWYAGGGTEIGYFANEDGGYEVMAGELDEGSAETPATRGNFKILFTL